MSNYRTFKYNDKDREGVFLGRNEHENDMVVTRDGYRTFKPDKVENLVESDKSLPEVHEFLKANLPNHLVQEALDQLSANIDG